MEEIRQLYLDLMKRCLTNWIYLDKETVQVTPRGLVERAIRKFLEVKGFYIVSKRLVNAQLRTLGRDKDLPAAHTMIGFKRLENIQACIESILSKNIPGDLVDAGIWQGGSSIFMRATLKAYCVRDRIVWACDSFEGCPKPNIAEYPKDKGVNFYRVKDLAVSLDQVKTNVERYGLLDEQIHFLKGWFKDVLPQAPIEKISLLRIDADLYESTMDALVYLYPKVSHGGYIIVDDFLEIPACRQAVLDYRKSFDIKDEIIEIDKDGIYWQRS